MKKFFYGLIVPMFLVFQVGSLRAADETNADKTKGAEPTKEVRLKRADMMDKMADMHKKMAECLRSDKLMSECRKEMMKDCPMAKSDDCPMMDEMGGMHGMDGMMGGHHEKGMMKGNKAGKPKQK